ncbi:hypothetical protein [Burkholderia sp. Ac-20365]|uniref:hypothetical protein n=1 Tax=Burkholderia sp. Ac-20365 TaxID=2703897 RepID=UPI00197B3B33|nr:hypothetical protein [Burkholderia sp. Ac-20365]MBN3761217.1 hypothetical protein [Burkholderia sp. Ac-20365]
MKKLLCVVLATLSVTAHADKLGLDGDWAPMYRQKLGPADRDTGLYADLFYETNSAMRTGDKVNIWVRANELLVGGQRDVVITHYAINCATQRSAQIAVAREEGDEVPHPEKLIDIKNPEYRSYGPSSPGMRVILFACKKIS